MDEQTPKETKAFILADLWINFRNADNFADFIEYNDIGLPLAYAVANNIASPTEKTWSFIDETFTLLLAGLGMDDTGFETLDDILAWTEEG